MKSIDNFRDPKYSFLMNSYPIDITYDGEKYRTLEHAYQAAKTDDLNDKARIRNAVSAREAKAIGRKVRIQYGWDVRRDSVMAKLLDLKFINTHLTSQLLATKNAELIAGGDRFWGKVNGVGSNNLGKLLMDCRHRIIKENTETFEKACRLYLQSSGWAHDDSGDLGNGGLFDECWVPPWDNDCQYSLVEATNVQKELSDDCEPPRPDLVWGSSAQVNKTSANNIYDDYDDSDSYDVDID